VHEDPRRHSILIERGGGELDPTAKIPRQDVVCGAALAEVREARAGLAVEILMLDPDPQRERGNPALAERPASLAVRLVGKGWMRRQEGERQAQEPRAR
jgi:hypothetical protein